MERELTMESKLLSRVVLVSRDEHNHILDCFPGPFAQEKLQKALALARILLTQGRPQLVRVEIHPDEHAFTSYTEKPLAVVTKEDLMEEENQ